ncbi:Polysaccharide pyruvyl transferase [Vibrio cholerae]|nr:putative monosaccharide biosynthesis protein [Vibrio cholerae]GHY51470.1 Polysaccharide pyruvyl transferase [Vibrio cholerae]
MKNKMNKIIIVNAQPGGNKGAEAMLETVLTKLYDTYSEKYDFYLEALSESTAYEKFKSRLGLNFNYCLFKPKNIRRPYDIDIKNGDCVIDIGGINYHDKSLKANIRNYIRHSFFIRYNAKLIFYTQDFGPCEKFTTKLLAKSIYNSAYGVFMRSDASLDMIKNVIKKDNIVYGPFPDCTLLLKPSDFDSELDSPYFVVSPSAIMYNTHGESYLECLFKTICSLKGRLRPVLLVHNFTANGENSDEGVTKSLYQKCQKENIKCDFICDESSPAKLKSILKNAEFTISSRYHVVVGSLSSGTPSIAVGWSHKYQEFLRLYNLTKLNLEFSTSLDKEILALVDSLEAEICKDIEINSCNEKLKGRVSESFECLSRLI